MRVDIRQLESQVSHLDRLLNRLQEVRAEVNLVAQSIRVQQIGDKKTTLQIRASLSKELAALLDREEGLRNLREALKHTAYAYEACEKKAISYGTNGRIQILYGLNPDFKPFSPEKIEPVRPAIINQTIDKLISPLVGKESR